MTAGVSNLVAAATIARADASPQRGRGQGHAFDHLSIGQNLKLQVLRQLEQHRYEVAFGGGRHIVESRVPLAAGSRIDAQVEGKGDKLELRYLGAQAPVPVDVTANSHAEDSTTSRIESLAAQYRVPLNAQAEVTIAKSAAKVNQPELMTRGGLFLQKLAQRVSADDLEALYRVLSPAAREGAAPLAQSPVDLDDLLDNDNVAATIADALDTATIPSDVNVADARNEANAGGEGEDDAQRALRLLNLQDEGSVAWRYGTLPLLVGGQLIELDLVMFREREQQGARGGLRRLVMTLDTTHFGRVHVEARAVDSRIIVTLSAASAEAVEVLSAYGEDVRAAIGQLGWAVDDVRYQIEAPHAGAAHEIVKHVLSSGSVDREL